jgi:hypothetical protein
MYPACYERAGRPLHIAVPSESVSWAAASSGAAGPFTRSSAGTRLRVQPPLRETHGETCCESVARCKSDPAEEARQDARVDLVRPRVGRGRTLLHNASVIPVRGQVWSEDGTLVPRRVSM